MTPELDIAREFRDVALGQRTSYFIEAFFYLFDFFIEFIGIGEYRTMRSGHDGRVQKRIIEVVTSGAISTNLICARLCHLLIENGSNLIGFHFIQECERCGEVELLDGFFQPLARFLLNGSHQSSLIINCTDRGNGPRPIS